MLIRKGSQVRFELDDGRELAAPRGSSMLHDPAGTKWGKCSLLFVSFRKNVRKPTEKELAGAPKDYLGREHSARVGTVELPPRALASWEKVGHVKEIMYVRHGTKARGGFYHPFGVRTALMLFRKGRHPILYKRGSAMRLELGGDCIADDRGIVYP
jgi:hypothetical protein